MKTSGKLALTCDATNAICRRLGMFVGFLLSAPACLDPTGLVVEGGAPGDAIVTDGGSPTSMGDGAAVAKDSGWDSGRAGTGGMGGSGGLGGAGGFGGLGGDGGTSGSGGLGGFGGSASLRAVDLLFVVDNSASMREEQENLARNFPAFMDELRKIPGGMPDLHIGVVSSDMGAGPTSVGGCRFYGDRGIFQVKPNCGLSPGAKFITSSDGGATKNFQGDISGVFGCMALLGTTGCGFEHQLQATRVALYESITPENRGFLRENAYLAIVIITDEDDCSADPGSDLFQLGMSVYNPAGEAPSLRCARYGHTCQGQPNTTGAINAPLLECKPVERGKLIDVKEMVHSVLALKKSPEKVLVSGIFGWPADPQTVQYRYGRNPGNMLLDYLPTCSSANGQATAALRMKRFVESFPRGRFFSICQDDLRPVMQNIGEQLARMLGP